MFEMAAAEAWDIDEELDFSIAEFLVKQGKKKLVIITLLRPPFFLTDPHLIFHKAKCYSIQFQRS